MKTATKVGRRASFCFLLTLFFLSLPVVGFWYARQVRQKRLDRALIAAVKARDADTADRLLAVGADANARDVPPETRSLWQILLDGLHGRWTPQPSKEACSALALALQNQVIDNQKSHACRPQPLQMVSSLLAHGARGDTRDMYDYEVIVPAAACGYTDITRLLLDHGADPNARDRLDNEVLDWAADYHDPETLELLLQRGADVNHQSKFGRTALMEAAKEGPEKSVRLLLEHQAAVNLQDKYGRTALMDAAERGKEEIVRLLLQHHADAQIKDRDGRSALQYCERSARWISKSTWFISKENNTFYEDRGLQLKLLRRFHRIKDMLVREAKTRKKS